MSAKGSKVVIIGAGGHARVLLAALAAQGLRPQGCIALTSPASPWPSEVVYLGSDAVLDTLDPRDTTIVNGVGSVASSAARRRIFEDAKQKGFGVLTVIHPSAYVAPDVVLGDGAQIMAAAVVQTGCTVGSNTLINTGAVLDHDCHVGAHCHIATGAALSGGVRLDDSVHVGTGAAIIQGVQLGSGSIVAAGAAIVDDVAAGAKVGGVPARPIAIQPER